MILLLSHVLKKGIAYPMKRLASSVLPLAVIALLLAACNNTSAPSTKQSTSASPQQVQVTLGDFFIHSARTTFVANTPYSLVIHNTGAHNHDFLIMAPGSTHLQSMDAVYQQAAAFVYNVAPKAIQTLNVTFRHTAPQGTLEMSSHYSGQYEAGMHLPITVNAPAGQSISAYPKAGPPTTLTLGQAAGQAACDAAVKVTIANKAFSAANVALNVGDTLTIHNTSDQQYTLTTQRSEVIRHTVLSANETEYVPFLQSGTFFLSSREDPAMKLKVVVASRQGQTCGFAPGATVSFEATYPTKTVSHYFWSSPIVTIKKGQTIMLSNLSDQNLTFKSAPDANLADHVEVDTNEQQLLLFPTSGAYTITCTQFPNLPVKVNVQE